MRTDVQKNQNNEVEAALQALSHGLTHLIFRNVQLVEEIHVKQTPMDDDVMKIKQIPCVLYKKKRIIHIAYY